MASISLQMAALSNVRVAGQVTYIPAHIKNGKRIPQQAIIPVMANSNRGTNRRDGSEGRVDSYRLTAWNKLADTICRSCPVGKEISVFATPQSYIGRLFNPDGSLRLDNHGQVIETTKHGYTITAIAFGADSAKHIADEIQQGTRPADWNVSGSPGWNQWSEERRRRQQVVWDGRSQSFGWARVFVPQGVQLDFSQPNQNQQGQRQQGQQFGSGQQQAQGQRTQFGSGQAGGWNNGQQQRTGPSFHGMNPEQAVRDHFQNPQQRGGWNNNQQAQSGGYGGGQMTNEDVPF